MFIPPVTDMGLSKSKLPCFVRLALIAAVAESRCELFLLAPLPLPLPTFSNGAAPIRDSLSFSLIAGDPTLRGDVISFSSLRLRALSRFLRASSSGLFTLSLSFPFSDTPTGVSLGDGNPHNGEHRPSTSSSSAIACS